MLGISQLSVRVSDVERAVRFYNGVLGLPLLFSQSNMALVDCQGIRLLLGIPEKPEFDHPGSTIYFKVADIEEAYRTLETAKVELAGKPHKVAEFNGYAVWMAFFYDPDRNLHALTSEVPVN
ncbi:VOC family protein [Cohnella endophytica]|uniref:VOC family protein n=1 Tax=Cohnella endophytica TaxID=2419778 RepID=A0A494XH21_9BACL|nr:VOC family protein [Cohnella endophytica]